MRIKTNMTHFRDIRIALGLSQVELAERLGLHQSTISRLESGAMEIDKRTDLAIKSLLDAKERGEAAHADVDAQPSNLKSSGKSTMISESCAQATAALA